MLGPLLRWRPTRWLVAQRWVLFDVALAVVLLIASAEQHGQEGVDFGWWVLALPAAAGLVIRRRWPLTAFLLASGGALLSHLDPYGGLDMIELAVPLTLYTMASGGRSRRTAAIALVSALVGVTALSVIHVLITSQPAATEQTTSTKQPDQYLADLAAKGVVVDPETEAAIRSKPTQFESSPPSVLGEAVAQAIGVMLLFGLAVAVGDSVRSRRAHLSALVQRADDLEREQHQRVALATAAERARISRELHDVVAHGLSVIVVQAQGAAAALDRHPDRAAEALQNVISTGRDSLADMRRLLDLVRRDPTEDPALAPEVGVAYLPDLVDRIRGAGTPVSLVITGEPVPLLASVDLSAYRIVQEALTNTIKHAGPKAGVVVRLDFQPERLEVEVVDDGVGGPAGEDGTGLRGIAERVGMLGGEWSAGPAPERGFRVWASLPLAAPE